MLRFNSTARGSHRVYRAIRQLHLWIGAWGALAAMVYGASGLLLNHRSGENAWPQGQTAEAGRSVVEIPVEARANPESLSLWLRDTRGLDAQSIRKGSPSDAGRTPSKWTLSGGTARNSWAMEYTPGSTAAELTKRQHDGLAATLRLHKNVGGGLGWTLLADSFGIGMLLLGISGLWMWARGRTPKQLVFSVTGMGVAVLIAVLVPALG
jgi:uncharacterized protein